MNALADHMLIAAGALILERLVGYPEYLAQRIGHPVQWMGALIGFLDARLNRDGDPPERRRRQGVLALVILFGVCALAAHWLAQALGSGPLGRVFLVLLAAPLIAQTSLATHVRAVERALREGLAPGRAAVAHIVGRDPESLDEAGIARAAIESLAENFSDAVVAPVLWLAILGLPGIVLFKAINTADSMIGHRTPRHEDFGRAAARADDLVNLPASRLSALLILAAGWLTRRTAFASAWARVRADAPKHRSPNAGWPEAAMAIVLGLRLAGPRHYDARRIDDAWMGDGRSDAGPADIGRALALYRTADNLLIALALLGLVLSRL